MTEAGKRWLHERWGLGGGVTTGERQRLIDAIAAIEAEAVAAHEATLRERGWMDEYEVETAAAMNFGDGQAAERARYQPILDNAIARHGDPHAYRADLCRCGMTNCPVRAAVLHIVEGSWLAETSGDEK